MNRLRHSPSAMLRALQMSERDVFVFVEGWRDRHFYDKVCRSGLAGSGLAYEVRTSRELGDGAQGKEGLLDFFLYLRRRGKLFHSFKGKKLCVLFFVDKDIDDYLHRLRRSAHLVYTRYYAIENHLFRHADLARATAAASGLDTASVEAVIGDQGAWLERAACEWKEWTKLCFLSRAVGANCRPNYKVPSRINDGPYGGVIPGKVAEARGEVCAGSTLQQPALESASRRADGAVEKAFRAGEHDRVFKGKWYAAFLAEDARRAAGGRQYNDGKLGDRVLEIVVALVDFTGPWAGHFVEPVRRVAALFGEERRADSAAGR